MPEQGCQVFIVYCFNHQFNLLHESTTETNSRQIQSRPL